VADINVSNQFAAGEKVTVTDSSGGTSRPRMPSQGRQRVEFKGLDPGWYRASQGDKSVVVAAKEPGQDAPIGAVPTPATPPTDVRHGLETGSRANNTLPESEAPTDETQTLTPVDEPAPAGLVTP
jgi:hypothetical protein